MANRAQYTYLTEPALHVHSSAGQGDGSVEHIRAAGPINRRSPTSPSHQIGIVVMKRPQVETEDRPQCGAPLSSLTLEQTGTYAPQ